MRVLAVLMALLFAVAAPAGEPEAARVLEQLRNTPKLEAFLREFPKGGELHTHLTGAVPPEKLIEIARRRGFCLDDQALLLIQRQPGTEGCPAGQSPAEQVRDGSEIYRRLIDAMSMRGNRAGPENGHKHFFQAFRVRIRWPETVLGDLVEDVIARAAAQNLNYVEVMFFPLEIQQTITLGAALPADAPLAAWMAALEKSDVFQRMIPDSVKAVDRIEEQLVKNRPAEAAAVARRYVVNAGRTRDPGSAFVQLAAGAALAARDPRVVGINLVAPEDNPVARRDFRLHMRMVDFLVARFPGTRVSLHAGELVPRLLPDAPEDLTFHIADSVWTAGAERIGHGSSIRYERDRESLLRAMRERGVLVEIALTSEETILGLKGRENPLPEYLRAGIPVSLNTDDEGILDTDLTREFLRAARDFNLDYGMLKQLARNSLEYSFLQGNSLFRTREYDAFVPPCTQTESDSCRAYLAANPKAEVQLRLEKQFTEFESQYK